MYSHTPLLSCVLIPVALSMRVDSFVAIPCGSNFLLHAGSEQMIICQTVHFKVAEVFLGQGNPLSFCVSG